MGAVHGERPGQDREVEEQERVQGAVKGERGTGYLGTIELDERHAGCGQ